MTRRKIPTRIEVANNNATKTAYNAYILTLFTLLILLTLLLLLITLLADWHIFTGCPEKAHFQNQHPAS